MGQWVSSLQGGQQWQNDAGYTTGGVDDNGNGPDGQPAGAAPGGNGDVSMPNNQSQSGTIGGASGGGSGGQSGGGQDPNTPNINTSRDANGNLVFSGQGSGGSGGQGGYGSTPAPAGGQNYAANYGSGNAYGSPGQVAANNAGGGGGGGMGGGSSGSVGGGYAPGQGLQQYPDSSNTYNQSTMGTGGANGGQLAPGTSKVGGNQPLGSTTQGTPSYGQTGGGFNPNSNAYTIAQPYGGGPQTMMGQTGFQGGGAGTPSSQYGSTGFKQAGPMDQSMTNQYQGMMQNPMQGLQTAQSNQNPYQGGPQNYLTMSGFNGQQAGLNPSLSTAGFQQGGIGGAPQAANQQYQNMLSNPTDMTANPAYKAIMDAATQATERTGLARGGNGGGTLQAELAKTGASVAGQYLPQMASMYNQGAQQETGNWNTQNQANLQAGGLGGSLYGSQNQANLGYGNLGGSLYGTSGNQAIGFGNQALQGYNTGVQNLGQGAQQQGTNYGLQSQANLGYGNMANNAYSAQNQANLGYGNLGNNAWQNTANNQFNMGSAYSNLAQGAQNTQTAAMNQAQMQPLQNAANQYAMNQLTMSNMG